MKDLNGRDLTQSGRTMSMVQEVVRAARQGANVCVLATSAAHVRHIEGLIAAETEDSDIIRRIVVKPYEALERGEVRGHRFACVFEDNAVEEVRAQEWKLRKSALVR